MRGKRTGFIGTAAFAVAVMAFHRTVFTQTIEGSSEIRLGSVLSASVKQKQHTAAFDGFAAALASWLKENERSDIDYDNPVSLYFLRSMAQAETQSITVKAGFENRTYRVRIQCNGQSVAAMTGRHNRYYDSAALAAYTAALHLQGKKDRYGSFRQMLRTLYCSLAHIGPAPVMTPGSPDEPLAHTVKDRIQECLDKIEITFNDPLIKGKPGQLPQQDVTVTATLDHATLRSFPVLFKNTAVGSTTVLSTDAGGMLSLSKQKIPFAPKGAIVYVMPHLASFFDTAFVLPVSALGVTLNENNSQSAMYNIIKVPYTLKFTFTTVPEIEIPRDFSNESFLKRFLSDSCSLEVASGSVAPELVLAVHCRVAKDTIKELDEMKVQLLASFTAQSLKTAGTKIQKSGMILEKRYPTNHPSQYGLFFWEGIAELKKFIHTALNEM